MPDFSTKGAVVLVSGANRGIGRSYVEALVAAGAQKVYATARQPESLADLVAAHPGKVKTFALDITNDQHVTQAAERAADVTLLINNAGVAKGGPILSEGGLSGAEFDLNVNVLGTAKMCRAFAPILGRNGGGAIVNVNSVASLVNFPIFGGYSASKAALHSITQSLRAELAKQGTHVMGVYPGPIDTDMAEPLEMPKEPPSAVADATIVGLAAGAEEVFPDAMAKDLANNFRSDWKAVEKNIAAMVMG